MPTSRCTSLQQHLQLLAQLEVERAERLVEQQHLGLQHERARERDALLLAAGELRAAARARGPRARPGRACARRCARIVVLRRLALAQAERDVLEHVEVREQRVVLEDGGDRPPVRRDAVSCRARRPRTRPAVGSCSPEIICSVVVLPQPLGPISEKNSPSRDVEVDAAHGGEVAEALLRPLEPRRTARAALTCDASSGAEPRAGRAAHAGQHRREREQAASSSASRARRSRSPPASRAGGSGRAAARAASPRSARRGTAT